MAFARRNLLVEEEKFLKQMQRNLQDQLNRLKIEELSLLKLISMSDINQYEQNFSRSIDSIGQLYTATETDMEGLGEDGTDIERGKDADDTPTPSVHFDINEKLLDMDQSVNALPLLDLNVSKPEQQSTSIVKDEEMEEEEEEDEEE